MAVFTIRPRSDRSGGSLGGGTTKSDATKDFWEHLFASDDGIYIYNTDPSNPYDYVGAQCYVSADAVGRTDIPSVSGSVNSKTYYVRVNAVDSGAAQQWHLKFGDGVTASVELYFAATGGYTTKNGTQSGVGSNLLSILTSCLYTFLEVTNDGNGYSYIDYIYVVIDYTPAVPDVSSQDIRALDTGNLALISGNIDSTKVTRLTSSGLQVRLKSTGASVHTVDNVGDKLSTSVSVELGSDILNYSTTYEARIYGGVDVEGKGYGAWVEFTTRSSGVTTEAVSDKGVDHAKGNGTVNASSTERGFEVKLAFSGTLYEYIQRHVAGFSSGTVSYNTATAKWEGDIVKTVSATGTFVAESFVDDLGRFPIAVFSDKLFAGESYTYRARATIGGIECYGDWVAFTMNSYPVGGGPDDQIPIDDIIPSMPPIEPVGPGLEPFESPFAEMEDFAENFPDLEFPSFEFPAFDYPDFPPYNGSWLGWFYYRKAYTKKDLDELRKKCRIFQDNSVEYALVINHNSRVLQQFLNNMSDYMSKDEHNTFRSIIPTQHLNALAHSPLDVYEFKAIINNFINNSIDNTNNVNNNFRLIKDGLSDYAYTEDEGFIDISITTKLVIDNNPDVDRLKKVVDRLNKEMANNYARINHNLHVLRAMLI